MADRRVFLNLAGTYFDTALICFAKQKGDNQALFNIQATSEAVTWARITVLNCALNSSI
jgi:hypothetical protein